MPRKKHPDIEAIIDHLRTAFPGRFTIDEVIRHCAAHGFSPFQTHEGLIQQLKVPSRQAREQVMTHPVWGKHAETMQRTHNAFVDALDELAADGEPPPGI